jgi:hypothetical protein
MMIRKENGKMKIVREHINEKFSEESDPIIDMGIGIYAKRNFNSETEEAQFIVKHLAAILKTEEIPANIIRSNQYYIQNRYCDKIFRFAKEYHTIKGKRWEDDRDFPYDEIHYMLKDKGYKSR